MNLPNLVRPFRPNQVRGLRHPQPPAGSEQDPEQREGEGGEDDRADQDAPLHAVAGAAAASPGT